MSGKAGERARFTEMRARALTDVLLTGREDLSVQDVSAFDYVIHYLVTIRSEKPGLRQFGVALRAAHSPVTVETANKVLRPAVQGVLGYGPFPYPTVLFYYTMMESQAWYTWISRPITHADHTLTLEMQQEPECAALDQAALGQIITRVNSWYDYSFSGKPGRAAHQSGASAPDGGKGGKNEVVITDVDSVIFDYSEEMIQSHELFAAAKECSAYIVITYPAPPGTVMGMWDLEEDEKGHVSVTLTIKGSPAKKSATAQFTPKELRNPQHVYQRFNALLGTLYPG